MLIRMLTILLVLLSAGSLLAGPRVSGCNAACGTVQPEDDCCTQTGLSPQPPAPSNSDTAPCSDCRTCGTCHTPSLPPMLLASAPHTPTHLIIDRIGAPSLAPMSFSTLPPPTPPPRA